MGTHLPSLSAAAVALMLCACASEAPGAAIPSASPSTVASGCRPGAPEAGVHNPDRLQVLSPCRHTAGVVVDVAHEDDGDYHIWFKVDLGYESLLNSENHFQAQPAMLAEVTPDCPPKSNPPDAAAAAKCPKSDLPIPVIGEHI